MLCSSICASSAHHAYICAVLHNCQAMNYMVDMQAAVHIGGQDFGSTGNVTADLMVIDMPRAESSDNHDSGTLQPMTAGKPCGFCTNTCLNNVLPISACTQYLIIDSTGVHCCVQGLHQPLTLSKVAAVTELWQQNCHCQPTCGCDLHNRDAKLSLVPSTYKYADSTTQCNIMHGTTELWVPYVER